MESRGANSLEKALLLLEHLLDGEDRSVEAAAARTGVPVSTAHRMVAAFRARAFVTLERKASYAAGPMLLRLAETGDLSSLLSKAARPILDDLARSTGLCVHLGVLEADMVTYLVKAPGVRDVLTREGMQLEAYCSGIGKVLLAHLPPDRLQTYLANGPFIRLTDATIVEPEKLAAHLSSVRAQEYALDEGEIHADLHCVAVSVRTAPRHVGAAISLSAPQPDNCLLSVEERVATLRAAAAGIERRLWAPRKPAPV